MTKRELIQAIAAKAGLTNAQAEAALDAFGAVITEGRNPATGEAMTIPARRVAKLTPATALKNAL